MSEFFRGWRRKVGCITLVIACLLGGFWARAYFYDDAITLTIFGPVAPRDLS